MADQEDHLVYREVQRWSLGFRCVLLLFLLSAAGFGIFAAVTTAKDDSSGLAPVLVIALCGVLIPIALAILVWVCRLETEVRPEGLCIRYFPFHSGFKTFRAEDFSECRARRYRPILEYGGYGIRWGWKGRAYNVSGNEGVQLVFKNGKRLLIGSSKSHQLEAAIRSIV